MKYLGFREEGLGDYKRYKRTVGKEKGSVYLAQTWASEFCSVRTKVQ